LPVVIDVSTMTRSGWLARAAVALMLAMLTACAPTTVSLPPIRPAANPTVTVVVRQGDTIYTIAQANNVPVRALIEANTLAPPYQLRPGQVLVLPGQDSYTVVAGDTLHGISRRHGVDMSSLARLNKLGPPFTIRVGQKLILPSPVAQQAAAPRPAAPLDPPRPREAPRAGVAVEALPPPAASPPTAPPTAPTPPAGAVPMEKPEPPVTDGAPAVPPPRPPLTSTSPPAVAAIPEPPARAGPGFLWPVRGTVLSNFGAKGGGLHNDGINIGAARGTPVRAAEAGVVAYAGNELRSFGNLLLIKHADGWITAYAHNERLLVKRGDTVRRGQSIAHVGATGSVSTPQLHFEIRRGSQVVDPRRYLSPSGV
jgi:murein DD-endopeptidase MepM/ murein hydrolase activator NlpD